MKPHSLHKFAGILATLLAAVILTSCDRYSPHADDLIEALPDAWDDSEDELENYAVELLNELEADPEQLAKNTQAEYIRFGNMFTLTHTIDYTARAIGSAIFGELADFAIAVNDASIDNKTKKDATQVINASFNKNWVLLFGAICALDGEFSLSYERDSFLDKTFDYEPSELVKILNDQGWLSGGFSIGGIAINQSSNDDTSVGEGDPPIEEDEANYRGTIAGKNVTMQLFFNDGDVTGWYRYDGNDGRLDLAGTFDGEFLTLEESYLGKKTGDLRIHVYSPLKLVGTITNYKGKTYDVDLSQID